MRLNPATVRAFALGILGALLLSGAAGAAEVRVMISGGLTPAYKVLVPEFVRRVLQDRVGGDVTLFITEYLEGNPMQGKMVPRRIGFLADAELEFFELHTAADIEHSDQGWNAVEQFARKLHMEEAVVSACERNLHVWEHYLNGIAAAGDALSGRRR